MKLFAKGYTIEAAEAHPMVNVKRAFWKRTEAKQERSRSLVTGMNVPGFLLRLTRMMNKTIMWVDLETCIALKLLPAGVEVDEASASELVGKKISFA